MSIKIIAFCGAKESGKSTSAELFKTLIKSKTTEVAFAGHLKEVCSKVFGIPMKYFLDTKLKESELDAYINLTTDSIQEIFERFDIKTYDYDSHIRKHVGQVFDTPRKLLQYVGTELLHPLDKLIHVNYALKQLDLNVITLVTDLRFPQEFDAIKDRPDFLPVYVDNKKAENNAAADTHASEQGWKIFKDYCVQLDNNSTLENLTANLQKLIMEKL